MDERIRKLERAAALGDDHARLELEVHGLRHASREERISSLVRVRVALVKDFKPDWSVGVTEIFDYALRLWGKPARGDKAKLKRLSEALYGELEPKRAQDRKVSIERTKLFKPFHDWQRGFHRIDNAAALEAHIAAAPRAFYQENQVPNGRGTYVDVLRWIDQNVEWLRQDLARRTSGTR